ncbi:CoA transferase [Myxococcota bacterium]|nr:CoA transferase [Myxococcota bacterium]
MSEILAGLRVLDCSSGMSGPRATGFLADCGADVVWVEPRGGDFKREILSVPYSVFNRGKRSIEIDPSVSDDLEILNALVRSSDILFVADEPGSFSWPDLDWVKIHETAPELIHCSITGFGDDTPWSDLPAYEPIVHAVVGSHAEQVGHREGPIYQGLPFASIGAAHLALIGVLAALYRRGIDGAGRRVETSLYDGALAYLSMMWGDVDDNPSTPAPGSHRLVATSFRCSDDEYLGVHTGAVGAFGRLMQVIGLDDRIPPSPDGLDMGVPLTPEQQELLETRIHEIFASRPREHWLESLLAADVCAVPHLRQGEVFDAPQAIHNEMTIRIEDPVLKSVDQVALPLRFGSSNPATFAPAPCPGAHREEILEQLRKTLVAPPKPVDPTVGSLPLLDGVRVLDLGAFYAGPYSSRLLAELGADVIKLEPVSGDPLRGLARVFRSAQAGKRSVAMDLKDPDLDVARRQLIEWADVIHHNMRPGVAERLGMGFEQVRELKPSVVYLYAPGWGSSGPSKDWQSFAPMLSGYVGVGFEVAGEFNPPLFPLGNEDPGNGLMGAVGILMALLNHQRSGDGLLVENPQLNAAMYHMAHVVRTPEGSVLGAEKLDPLQRGTGPLSRLYKTEDGWLCLVAETIEEIDALSRATKVEIRTDQRFESEAQRQIQRDELSLALERQFETRSTRHWIERLTEFGVPVAEPVEYNATRFLRDPAHQRSGRAVELPHARDGRVRQVGHLVRVSDAASVEFRLAPELGEHTESLLSSFGYEPESLSELRKRGSIR